MHAAKDESTNGQLLVTVITPTYNRAHTLRGCYDSLLRQTNQQFEWVIVDDGSTDNTSTLVADLQAEARLTMQYQQKANGGKHTAVNMAMDMGHGELMLILDSDDQLTPDAIETIIQHWTRYRSSRNIVGMCFLKGYQDGSCIGNEFPTNPFISTYVEVRRNLNIRGDKLDTYRLDAMRNLHYPVVPNERFMNSDILYQKLSDDYQTVHINKILYLADYLPDGLTKAGRKHRIRNPRGMMMDSEVMFGLKKQQLTLKYKIKYAMLYVCYAFFAGVSPKGILTQAPNRFWITVCFLPGYLLYRYWKNKFL